ncbi:hypothetical protein ACGF5F_34385 [Streptomyces sp. NPDC047821]|uniref:hypothetical protein n=1 Tax=unclassified Streptomyces TaxID=2593676 RepID=UPI00362F7E12
MQKNIGVLSFRIRVASCAVVAGLGLAVAGLADSADRIASPAEKIVSNGDVGWNVVKPSVAA